MRESKQKLILPINDNQNDKDKRSKEKMFLEARKLMATAKKEACSSLILKITNGTKRNREQSVDLLRS